MIRFVMVLALMSACAPGNVPPTDETTPFLDAAPPPPCVAGAAAMIGARPFRSVQDALDAMVPPVTVTVCSGVHQEVNLFTASAGPFRLAGETGNPADVVFDVAHQGPLFDFGAQAPATIQLDSFTVRDAGCGPGCAPDSVVQTFPNAHRLRLRNWIVEDADAGGDLIAPWLEELVLEDSLFRRNRSDDALVGVVTPSAAIRPRVRISGCTFEDNAVQDVVEMRVGGLGVFSRVQVEDSVFQRNTASNSAGLTLLASPGDALVEVSGSAFRENVVTNLDATPGVMLGLSDQGRMRAHLTDLTFEDNLGGVSSAVDLWGFGAYRGAGQAVGHAWIERSSFLRNTAQGGGGGVIQTGSPGTWDVMYDDVEFGSGADDNVPFDLARCLQPLGFVQHGYTRDLPPSDVCP